ncbi:MAG: helix-turn-helix domain-containing protein [Beutenbergiaceae bacterium]
MRTQPYEWTFRTDSVDVASRSWERMLSENHLEWSLDELFWPEESFSAGVRRRALGDLILVDCACDPSTGHRGQGQVARTDGEYFVLLMTLAGREVVEQGPDQSQLRPGSAVVWDSERPARYRVQQRLRKRSLIVPKSALGELGTRGRLRPGSVLHAQQPAMRLLAGYLDTIAHTIDDLPLQSIAAVRNATLELLGAALHAAASDGARPAAAVLTQAQRYIDEHLRDPALSPAAVASAVGVSLRTLHRLFSGAEVGVAEHIRMRRLAVARDDILAGASITATARRMQFSDGSHFTRSFKQAYGHTPREAAAAIPSR